METWIRYFNEQSVVTNNRWGDYWMNFAPGYDCWLSVFWTSVLAAVLMIRMSSSRHTFRQFVDLGNSEEAALRNWLPGYERFTNEI